jgi:hypothetical protein
MKKPASDRRLFCGAKTSGKACGSDFSRDAFLQHTNNIATEVAPTRKSIAHRVRSYTPVSIVEAQRQPEVIG